MDDLDEMDDLDDLNKKKSVIIHALLIPNCLNFRLKLLMICFL